MKEKFNIVLRFKNKYIHIDKFYTEEFDTIKEHQKIISEAGFVWWGKFGKKLGNQKIDLTVTNLSRNLEVFLYLFSEDKCYKAKLEYLTNERRDVNFDLIPAYYRQHLNWEDNIGTYFKISNIIEVDYSYNLLNLELLSNQTKGSLLRGFKSQQTYFYVK